MEDIMAKIYNALKPEYSGWEWFKFIAIRTIFPPILLWDLAKFGINKLVGELVSSLVLPAQDDDFDDLAITDDTVTQHNGREFICEKHEVITHDEAHLDTFELRHGSQIPLNPEHQKYIINFVGNGMCYEDIINQMKDDARDLKTNVIGFNLRGVGQSTGQAKSKEDLVTDGIAQVQRLLDQGVSPENITLKGHSLGAGIASLVTKHFHELRQPINVFNSRSFSSITNFLVGHIRLERDEAGRAVGHKDSIGGIILGWLAKPFIALGVALVNWEIDAGSAFKSIPGAYKDYVVVRSPKSKRDNRLDDAVIPHYASIHKELSSERREQKADLDEEIENLTSLMHRADPLTKPGLAQAKQSLVESREKLKSDRKMETDYEDENGHNAGWDYLQNRSGTSAHTFFHEFVQRTREDHAVNRSPKHN